MGDLLEIVDEKNDQPEVHLKEHKKPDTINLQQLVNRLNYINFQDGTLTSVFNHKNYKRSISINMKPKACLDNILSCLWPDGDNLQKEIMKYNLSKIYIDDGINTVVINPDNVNFEKEGFSLELPEINILKQPRKIRRHNVSGIQVQMIQNGILHRGRLSNFTPDSFKIDFPAELIQSINIINSDVAVTVIFISEQQIKFSGECSIIRLIKTEETFSCILEPVKNQIQRFKAKKYRSSRHKLIPSPSIVFKHPLTGSRVDLAVYDLSGSGFSVEEEERTGILLPGLIIPELEIVLSQGMKVKCKAQILYRKKIINDNKNPGFLAGFSIMEMKPYDYTQFLSIVFLAGNKNIYLSKDLDTDVLWRFLFESGFIYPSKYAHLKDHKEEIKSTYKKLYYNSPDIARHITYQEKGEILGHVSILRTYEKAWLMHHHASSSSSNHGAGLYVMDQMANYTYNAHKIESLHVNFLICYYRPENKFPARIFGGTAKSINNKKGCSIDNFVFFNFKGNSEIIFDDLNLWSINESNQEDLLCLESYYEDKSGGLALEAMDILPNYSQCRGVKKKFKELQFKREMNVYSLKMEDKLIAVFIVDVADTGINMSELANSIKVIIMEPDDLPKEQLDSTLNEISKTHYENSAHVLLYPDTYADNNSMEYEKKYNMWVISMEQSDAYFKYLNKLLRFIKK
jgi:hypothetical protein